MRAAMRARDTAIWGHERSISQATHKVKIPCILLLRLLRERHNLWEDYSKGPHWRPRRS